MSEQESTRTRQWALLVVSPLVGLTGAVMFYSGFDQLMVNWFDAVGAATGLVGLVMMLAGMYGLQYVKNAGVNHA